MTKRRGREKEYNGNDLHWRVLETKKIESERGQDNGERETSAFELGVRRVESVAKALKGSAKGGWSARISERGTDQKARSTHLLLAVDELQTEDAEVGSELGKTKEEDHSGDQTGHDLPEERDVAGGVGAGLQDDERK